MSKLSPKPNRKTSFKTWEDLNETLQANFGKMNFTSASISLDEYDISKEEIIAEATKQGYSVTEPSLGILEFR